MGIKDTVRKVAQAITGKSIELGRMYDYSTKESREVTIPYLYEYAKTNRSPQTAKWVMYDQYYNNQHVAQKEISEACRERKIPYIPAVITDPFIHVESQIIPDVPDFEFSGRDDDLDSVKAKQREYVVRFVAENNKLENMNTDNERRLNKLGNALWKVAFNYGITGPGYNGEIVIGNPSPPNIFPDPSAVEVDDCEFLDYVYPMHKMKVAREFTKDLIRLGLSVHELDSGNDTKIFNSQTQDINDDTLEIVEHWFRQPVEGSDTKEYGIDGRTVKRKVSWEAGDIACSIFIGEREIRYIPKYWENTGKQNKSYPFVKYCKIPVDQSFWDMSEIAPIKELTDAADRELSTTLLNDAFMGNDIILMEEEALVEEVDAFPGAIWRTKQGKSDAVQRLGGLGSYNEGLKGTITFIRELIQETVGNFDSSSGKEPVRVTTASGIAQLNEKADARKTIKKADRLTGFERLYELIDWTALEFYDDSRLIFIGAKTEEAKKNFGQTRVANQPYQNIDPTQGPISFMYNANKMRSLDIEQTDLAGEAMYYYPRIDATVHAGDGIKKSKAFTLSATESLLKINITPQNYKIVQAMVDIMDLPNRKGIKEDLEKQFTPMPPNNNLGNGVVNSEPNIDDIMSQFTPEEMEALKNHPEILDGMLGGGM